MESEGIAVDEALSGLVNSLATSHEHIGDTEMDW